MRTSIIPFLFLTTTLWAQTPPPCRLSPLDTYLDFACNSPKAEAIRRNNNEHERWRAQKERRIYQVRSEIADETNRSPLDPTALGLRYAEVESICREIDERETQLVQANRNALAEPQKVKLAALEEAMRLVPIANAAIGQRLIEASTVALPSLPRAFDPSQPVIERPLPTWPAKQRTGACAAIPSVIIPVLTPTPNTTSP
ncbi:MAG: hypothetical protein J0L64_13325 [Acidobacteria bacterium]|nr:hypothetical protein [Acidobacteriota bacterium]